MRFSRRHADERGAATTEFALSTLVAVSAALFSMYVGEAFVMGAKAQEAEISAGWDTTAYLLHDYNSGNHTGLYNNAISRSQQKVQAAITDFDSFTPGGGSRRSLVVSDQTFQGLTCTRRSGNVAFSSIQSGKNFLHPDGLVGCRAEVGFTNKLLGQKAHEEFYKNKPDQLPGTLRSFSMCGLGASVWGCNGSGGQSGFVVLTDDWGLEDGTENRIGTKNNAKYWKVGSKVYGGGPAAGANAAAMAMLLGAGDMGQSSTFKLGYLSAISKKQTISSDQGPRDAHMSPWDEEAHADTDNTAGISSRVYNERRNNNYLGKSQADFIDSP